MDQVTTALRATRTKVRKAAINPSTPDNWLDARDHPTSGPPVSQTGKASMKCDEVTKGRNAGLTSVFGMGRLALTALFPGSDIWGGYRRFLPQAIRETFEERSSPARTSSTRDPVRAPHQSVSRLKAPLRRENLSCDWCHTVAGFVSLCVCVGAVSQQCRENFIV